jgi:sporulation protein YlmC with PRC-barrel domain
MKDESSTHNLVSTSDVNGEAVYSPSGDHIGTIDHLMIDKNSGKVAYAVMTFGGFLGIGEETFPVPWKKLNYDTSRNGFTTDITEDDLNDAPPHDDRWSRDRTYEERLHTHYGVMNPYWY